MPNRTAGLFKFQEMSVRLADKQKSHSDKPTARLQSE